MEKLRVGLVSYLNTKPFLFGLQHSDLLNEITLTLDVPSEGASRFQRGEVDLGLVPVAAIPEFPHAEIVTDYCIGADGPVLSVCIFSQVPMENINTILLDYQSRTSVELCRILLRDHFRKEVNLLPAQPGFEDAIKDQTAALIIGDRAIQMSGKYNFSYDLADEWKKMTGKPFVFAVWLSRKKPDPVFIGRLNAALKFGISNIAKVAEEYEGFFPENFDTINYLKKNISYNFDSPKSEALKHFLEMISTRGGS